MDQVGVSADALAAAVAQQVENMPAAGRKLRAAIYRAVALRMEAAADVLEAETAALQGKGRKL